ncbi:MAG TPA: hypothetical protein VEJ47_16125 [Candidatus Eremiobacteraceae bacterium]|nr:hypothetical protein [Candidatus Eremiobacteraceae bacterium]
MKCERKKLSRSYFRYACLASVTILSIPFVPAAFANNDKPTEVPAKVIAHVPLLEAPGAEMLLQKSGDKQYLYVQKASKQGFMIVDVTKDQQPTLLKTSAATNDATSGKLEMAGSDVAIAEVPDKAAKGTIRSTDNPTETVKILDLSDPAHPKVLQTFKGVTSILQEPGRGLIYLANNDGLWILSHPKPAVMVPAKKKKECGSEDALAAMPPDCL